MVLPLVSSPRVQEQSGRANMVLIAVDAWPVGSEPPAAGGVRISTGERYNFVASALLSIRASSQQGRAAGSFVMPKLVELVGLASTLFAEELSSCFARPYAASSICL